MKIFAFYLMAVILTATLVNAHYHHNFGEHQKLMTKYQGQRPVQSVPFRYGSTRTGVKAALEGHSYPKRASRVPTTPVYFAQEEDISDLQLKDLCNQLDTYNGDPHSLSRDEFAEFLRSFGVDFDDARIDRIYKKINNSRSAGFDLDRFCERKFKQTKKSEREELEEIFKGIDKNGSGKIDRKEIRKEMKRRNIFNSEFLDQLLDDADKNGDGKINFKEFLNIAEIL